MEQIKTIDLSTARSGQLIARAITHNLRKKIIDLLLTEGELNVTSIYTHPTFRDDLTGRYLEQSQVSQHLSILRKANIVTTRRKGKMVFYKVDKGTLLHVQDCIEELAKVAA